MPSTLLDHLVTLFPDAKRQTLKRMVEAGRVTINRRRAKTLKDPITPTDKIVVHDPPPKPKPAPPVQHAALHIVHEDADLVVVDKPAGLLTSTVPDEPRPTLLAIVKDHVHQTTPRAIVGLIHRLDRDVSGLLVFSKNPDAFESLKNQLFKRTMKRVYAAIVIGKPAQTSGTFESRLVELPDGTVRSSRVEDKGERAVTDYQLLTTAGGRSLLRITLHTGRKHQIRVHLSERKLPILGDPVYAQGKPTTRLMLAAIHLSFTHPKSGKPMKFELPLPKEFKEALKE